MSDRDAVERVARYLDDWTDEDLPPTYRGNKDAHLGRMAARELRALLAENDKLRELLWLRHGCGGLYGDDGEMQCGRCILDFKRDPVEVIEERWRSAGERAVRAALAAADGPRSGPPENGAE